MRTSFLAGIQPAPSGGPVDAKATSQAQSARGSIDHENHWWDGDFLTLMVQGCRWDFLPYAATTPVSQSFTVQPAANFTITPIPSAETVYRGVVGAFGLKLQSVRGFNGKVTLS